MECTFYYAYMTDDEVSRDQARERLAEAERLAAATTRRAAPVAIITTAGIGILVALGLAVCYLTLPDHKVAFAVSFTAYAAAVISVVLWSHRRKVVTQHGFGRAYNRAFSLTMTFYVIGLAFLVVDWAWPIAAAYCVAVAMPMVVAAGRMARGRP
jgi:hypothetical protein